MIKTRSNLQIASPTCISRLLFLVAVIALLPATLAAQQPFITDDADVTPKRRFHLEFSNQFDWLNRDAFPSLRQNTADVELGRWVETIH